MQGSGCSVLAPQFELSLDWGAREEPWASEERLLSHVGRPESQVRVHLPRDGGPWGWEHFSEPPSCLPPWLATLAVFGLPPRAVAQPSGY